MVEYNEEELLIGLGLMEDGLLNNAGFYLFSNKKPTILKMATYVTDERINFSDIRRLEDNVFNLVDIGYRYIIEKMNWCVESNGSTSRVEMPEFPVDAIREILVNSFAHADYRGVTENEIDIIIQANGKLTFVEIKSGMNFNNNSVKGFKALDNTQYTIDTSSVICLNESVYKINDNVYALPVSVI